MRASTFLAGLAASLFLSSAIAETIAPTYEGSGTYALAVVYEDAFLNGGFQPRDDVAAFAAIGLDAAECSDLRDSLLATGGFAACFDGDAPVSVPAPLVEKDPVACVIAHDSPTDSNLFECYGEVADSHF